MYNIYDVQCVESGSQWIVKAKSKEDARQLIIGDNRYDYDNDSEFFVDLMFDTSEKDEVYCNGF